MNCKTRYIKSILDKKPIVPEELVIEIYKKGRLTGSNLFNCQDEFSDIDMILPPDFKYSNQDIINMGGVYADSYSSMGGISSIYIKINEKQDICNVILTHSDEIYEKLLETNRVICRLINMNNNIKNSIKDKNIRIKLYNLIKNIV